MSKIKCLLCGTILESLYNHDYKTCGCPNGTFIDGGRFLRFGGKDLDKIVVVAPIPDDENTMTRQEIENEIKN